MSRYVLDTSALLALRDNEPGADRVQTLLEQSARSEITCYGCFMSQMELLYRIWKDEGKAAARTAYSLCLLLPITWSQTSTRLLERAAELKACFPLSVADAWIAATALELDAVLVHKDPEFERISGLAQQVLPYR